MVGRPISCLACSTFRFQQRVNLTQKTDFSGIQSSKKIRSLDSGRYWVNRWVLVESVVARDWLRGLSPTPSTTPMHACMVRNSEGNKSALLNRLSSA